MVQGRLGILEGDPTHVIVERLSAGLEHYVTDPSDRDWLRPRLATLLGVGDQVTPGASFARDDLFAAWRTFLEQVAVSEDAAGAFLRIDDLQWADRGLLDFIEHVVETARVPLFILTLARSELTESAPTFGTGRRATALHLEPLPSPAMATLVDGLVEGLPDTLREALVERAEGVPLFAVETVRSLIDRDVVVPRDGRYVFADDGDVRVDLAQESLPTSLHTLIASRLDGLLPQERRLVQDAAVLGQAFSLAGLSALVAATGDDIDVAPALDALVRKEIIAVESDPRSPERGQYRFVQATVRTVAYDTLSRRDRKARHICAAEHLAQEPDADTIPAVIAAHYVDAHAAAAADEDADELAAKAVELLERAAVRASDLGAPAEARRHFETAMSLVSEPTEVARLSVAAAAAAISAGATEDAASLADRAREQYEQAGLATDAARALAVWGDAMIAAGTGQEVVEPLSVAYEQLPDLPQNAATRAQLALGVARGYYLSKGESQEAIPWFDRAVALAEALDELPLLVQTLSSYAGALVLVGRSRMGLGLLRVSLDLARELDDPKLQLRPLNNLVSFLATRDLRGSLAYAEEALAIVRRLGDREWGDFVASSAAHAHWNSGAWDELPQIAQGATQMEHTSPSRTLLFCYRACVDEARGTPVELPTDTTPEASRTDVLVQALHSLAEAFRRRAESDVVGAAAASRSAAQLSYSSAGIDDDFALFWMQAMADQLAVGDLPSAQDVFALVAEAPRGHVSPLLRALLPWMQARVKLLEDPQADVGANFVAAASALRSFGATYYLARTLLDHAQWLDEQHRPAEALPLLEEARELFSALGARPWVDRSSGRSSARLTQGVRAGT
jgi:tetratricopeptide (TPR) repeat protein